MRFLMQPLSPDTQGVWLLTQGSAIYLIDGKLPQGLASAFQLQGLPAMEIGRMERAGETQPLWLVAEQEQDWREYTSLRSQLHLPEIQFNLLNRGVEINHFLKTHRFCGRCGSPMAMVGEELAMQKCRLFAPHLPCDLSLYYCSSAEREADFARQSFASSAGKNVHHFGRICGSRRKF